MIKYEKANEVDYEGVKNLLEELNFPSVTIEEGDFWVVKFEKEIVGVAKVQCFDEYHFMSYLGVAKHMRNRGLGIGFIKMLLDKTDKSVYLYTIIPDFFRRVSFEVVNFDPKLPAREQFGCKDCIPNKCVCMVRR
ncbi:MAG: hypothetical protein ABIE74_02205 [Pseudomonadota bacterium]